MKMINADLWTYTGEARVSFLRRSSPFHASYKVVEEKKKVKKKK